MTPNTMIQIFCVIILGLALIAFLVMWKKIIEEDGLAKGIRLATLPSRLQRWIKGEDFF